MGRARVGRELERMGSAQYLSALAPSTKVAAHSKTRERAEERRGYGGEIWQNAIMGGRCSASRGHKTNDALFRRGCGGSPKNFGERQTDFLLQTCIEQRFRANSRRKLQLLCSLKAHKKF